MTRHEKAARILLAARRDGVVIDALPDALTPADQADAYAIQRMVMAGLGSIGGWKVGAPGPDGPISCAPMPKSFFGQAPATLPATRFRQREIESEIGFMIGRDLPSGGTPFTPEDVTGAITSCHAGIEVLQSAFADPEAAGGLSVLADLIQHGAYIVGPPVASWEAIDFASLEIVQSIEGGQTKIATGNPAGDMFRLLVWLANEGAAWAGGLKAGQFVTCGSWTGKTRAGAGAEVTAAFDGQAPVRLRFASRGSV